MRPARRHRPEPARSVVEDGRPSQEATPVHQHSDDDRQQGAAAGLDSRALRAGAQLSGEASRPHSAHLPASGPYQRSAWPVTAATDSKSRSRCSRVSPCNSAVAATTRSTAPALRCRPRRVKLLDSPGAVVGAVVDRYPAENQAHVFDACARSAPERPLWKNSSSAMGQVAMRPAAAARSHPYCSASPRSSRASARVSISYCAAFTGGSSPCPRFVLDEAEVEGALCRRRPQTGECRSRPPPGGGGRFADRRGTPRSLADGRPPPASARLSR